MDDLLQTARQHTPTEDWQLYCTHRTYSCFSCKVRRVLNLAHSISRKSAKTCATRGSMPPAAAIASTTAVRPSKSHTHPTPRRKGGVRSLGRGGSLGVRSLGVNISDRPYRLPYESCYEFTTSHLLYRRARIAMRSG